MVDVVRLGGVMQHATAWSVFAPQMVDIDT